VWTDEYNKQNNIARKGAACGDAACSLPLPRLRFVILMTDTWRVKRCIRFNATLLHDSFADENRSDD